MTTTQLKKPDPQRLSCFVVMPFGDKEDHRGVTMHLDNVYEELIEPAVKLCEDDTRAIDIKRADKIPGSGSIHREMFEQLLEADIAVVDLTLANANVFYELGVRHALRSRVTVLIREEHTAIPFNVAGQKVIGYRVGFGDPVAAKAAIADDIKAGLRGRADSPVLDLLELRSQEKPGRLDPGVRYRAPVGAKSIEIATGDLAKQPRYANVWVNSENTYFSMARPFEASVSATIRWLGGDENGQDIIYRELEDEVLARGKRPGDPCDVIVTGSGNLKESHGVDRIFHVASVTATKGRGFRPVDGVERCVSAVLQAVQADDLTPTGTKVLFPIMGTGRGGAQVGDIMGLLLNEARVMLESDRIEKVDSVLFLARTRQDLDQSIWAGTDVGLEWQAATS